MAYRVIMELIPRPDDVDEWAWNGTGTDISLSGGKAWTAKLNTSDSINEFDSESDADTRMTELDAADSTNRRYKVIEV
jgi:hypothetical protein